MKKIISYIMLLLTFVFMGGNVMADTLTTKQKNIATISSYVAAGNMDLLGPALNKALDDGLTVNEIKEILVQLYAYCGFPRSLNAINKFMEVVNTRVKAGKSDTVGEYPTELSKNEDKDAYGAKVRLSLIKANKFSAPFADFVPAIDTFLKEHLFADIFARGVLTNQEREIATVAALSSLSGVESQLNSHIQMAKNTGVTDAQIKEILLTTSWLKNNSFGIGNPNDAYAKYFIGQSYLNPLNDKEVNIANVTFEPRCRNNWHIHHKAGQILLVTDGRGYYQEWGKPARELKAGDVVYIAPEIKHWHGAAKDSWFAHIAMSVPVEGSSNEWLEEVSDKEYNKLK